MGTMQQLYYCDPSRLYTRPTVLPKYVADLKMVVPTHSEGATTKKVERMVMIIGRMD